MADIKTFTAEYRAIRKVLKDESFGNSAGDVIEELRKLLHHDGPDVAHAKVLSELRDLYRKGGKESDGILSLAGADTHLGVKAGALKTMRHFYLCTQRGGHTVWMLSLPRAFTRWATDDMKNKKREDIKPRLETSDEFWGPSDRKDIQWATQEALKWVMKAMIICGTDDAAAQAMVGRWFGDEKTTEKQLATYRRKLLAGFKKIAATLNSTKLILAHNPTSHVEKRLEEAEAYMSTADKLKVLYIESEFFNQDNVMAGKTNWPRIIVHELAHSEVDIDDIDGHYAWQGIQPWRRGFSSRKAMNNADNWAFFAADCAGALTSVERNTALTKV